MSSDGGSIVPMLGVAFAAALATGLLLAWLAARAETRLPRAMPRLVSLLCVVLLAAGVASTVAARTVGEGWWAAYGEETAFWLLLVGVVLLPVAWRLRPWASRADVA